MASSGGPVLPSRAPVVAGNRYPALDGLRAVAVLAVVATHIGFQTGQTFRGTVGAVLARGDIGVTVFFVLSGFLLYLSHARAHLSGGPSPRVLPYLRNRALRVLPAYWLVLAVVLPTLDRSLAHPGQVVLQVLLLQVYALGNLLGGLTQVWSLAVEVAFYLALPLLARLALLGRPRTTGRQLRGEAWLLGGLLLTTLGWTVLVRATSLVDQRVTGLWLPQYLDWFALGMGLAVLRAWHDRTGRGRGLDALGDAAGTCWAVAALLFWLTTTPLAGPRGLDSPTTWQALAKNLLYAAFALALVLPAVFGTDPRSPVRRLLESRPARELGRISYGVFLWHLLALDLVFRLTSLEPFDGHALLVAALVLPASLATAELSLRLVEEPALRRKRPTLPAAAPQPCAAEVAKAR